MTDLALKLFGVAEESLFEPVEFFYEKLPSLGFSEEGIYVIMTVDGGTNLLCETADKPDKQYFIDIIVEEE